MKKLLIIILLIPNIFRVMAADPPPERMGFPNDYQSIFKMQLFLDKLVWFNKYNEKKYSTHNLSREDAVFYGKTDETYLMFTKYLQLSIDTLKTENIRANYVFLRIKACWWDDCGISYNEEARPKSADVTELMMFGVSSYPCHCNYILCVNTFTSKSYRLAGFQGNDFPTFMRDYRNELDYRYYYIRDRKFINDAKVEELDMKCLYHVMRKGFSKKSIWQSRCLCRIEMP